MHPMTPHPKGTRARVLLSSVFGPYAQDDEYGSRAANPMELYQNQVTRVQGGFSLRMFHRSFALLMLQANIEASCAVLDFPSRERFAEELQNQPYDIIGISARESREELSRSFKQLGDSIATRMAEVGELLKNQLDTFASQLRHLTATNDKRLENMRATVESQLKALQEDKAESDALLFKFLLVHWLVASTPEPSIVIPHAKAKRIGPSTVPD